MWEVIKWIVCLALAHILAPFIITILSIVLIQYWCGYLFDFSPLHTATQDGLLGGFFTVLWVLFFLLQLICAWQWWFLKD